LFGFYGLEKCVFIVAVSDFIFCNPISVQAAIGSASAIGEVLLAICFQILSIYYLIIHIIIAYNVQY